MAKINQRSPPGTVLKTKKRQKTSSKKYPDSLWKAPYLKLDQSCTIVKGHVLGLFLAIPGIHADTPLNHQKKKEPPEHCFVRMFETRRATAATALARKKNKTQLSEHIMQVSVAILAHAAAREGDH